MKNRVQTLSVAVVLLSLLTLDVPLSILHAQGTAFTYQGRLNNGGDPASGTYSLAVSLYTNNASGIAIAGPVTNNGVVVTNGLFMMTIDFGSSVWSGATNWLEIGVATNGTSTFTTLAPRQQLTPTPYAIFSESASNVTGLIPAGGLGGGYSGAVTLSNINNNFNGSYSGNGAGLTGVNAAALNGLSATNFWKTTGNSGTVPGVNFAGTTDSNAFEIRVNGTRAFRIEPTPNTPNIVGGYAGNFVAGGLAYGVTIGGGGGNGVTNYVTGTNATFATIAGGVANSIQGSNTYHSAIGGGFLNTISGDTVIESTIAGGYNNSIQSELAFIGGGYGNSIQSNVGFSAISGGIGNGISGTTNPPNVIYAATIAGGAGNIIGGYAYESTISGGVANSIQSGAYYSVIGGGYQNIIQTNTPGSMIAGGYQNTIQTGAFESAIGGGGGNSIQTNSNDSFIGGGYLNTIQTNDYEATIAGGWTTLIEGNNEQSTIGGGSFNTIHLGAAESTISGGVDNTIQTNAVLATIPGGFSNTVGGSFSFAAGYRAQATNSGAFVWADAEGTPFASMNDNSFNVRASGGVVFVTGGTGMTLDGQPVLTGGFNNLNDANHSFIGGGEANVIQPGVIDALIGAGNNNTIQMNAHDAIIGGGNASTIQTNADHSVIAGGWMNLIQYYGYESVISGGELNDIGPFAQWSVIGGGEFNTNNTSYSVIGGGSANVIQSNSVASVIAGGNANTISGSYSFVGGGIANLAAGVLSTAVGGQGNLAIANNSTVVGGLFNTNSGVLGFIGAGSGNTILGGAFDAAIGGGNVNTIQGTAPYATIGGGGNNIAGGRSSFIGGGGGFDSGNGGPYPNQAYGDWSAVVGGWNNTAFAYSAVIGGGARNTIQSNAMYSTIPGGLENVTGGNYSFAAGFNAQATNSGAFVWSDGTGTATTSTNNNSVTMRASGGYRLFSTTANAAFAYLAPGSGSWTSLSDRNAKEHFESVNPVDVLDRVAALPLNTWNYKTQPASIRHIGPTAQDFKAAFAVGETDTGISTVDEGGVALAAIQGLNRKVDDKETKIQEQATEINELKARLDRLEKLISNPDHK